MMYDDDALDAALFALPLEVPPADLRSSILAHTVFRPAPAFGVWEVASFGALAAVVLWLVVQIALGDGGVLLQSVTSTAGKLGGALSDTTALAWTAAGAAAALWLSYFGGWHPLGAAQQRYEPSDGR